MNSLQFKTNINCGGCIKAVTPFLSEVEGIQNWTVDTQNPDKILVVEGENVTVAEVVAVVQEAGFEIAELSEK